jgi:methylated-DNA-[protein]-cysteine S-methyltransferase
MDTQPGRTQHCLFDTALGDCGLAWSGRGLCAVQLPDKARPLTERRLVAKSGSAGTAAPPAWIAMLIADVRNYLAGGRVDFSAVAVDLGGLQPFRQRLYLALREIGFGATTTYGELARRLGLTGWEGARDIGAAMGQNPMPIVIPCHRVLAAGGKLGGFSAPGGAATKAKLLALEGVHLGRAAPRLPGL